MLDLTRRSKCQYGASHTIFLSYEVASESVVEPCIKTIIHWWIKYANYVERLGADVQKTVFTYTIMAEQLFSLKTVEAAFQLLLEGVTYFSMYEQRNTILFAFKMYT